ncbi:hypothetical protein LT493_08905 [Streptomyces tricolor]|nr:hypothetical protein [Streptomyces tricolor]
MPKARAFDGDKPLKSVDEVTSLCGQRERYSCSFKLAPERKRGVHQRRLLGVQRRHQLHQLGHDHQADGGTGHHQHRQHRRRDLRQRHHRGHRLDRQRGQRLRHR